MRVDLTGHHVEISPGLRRLVERKLQKVQRVVNDAAVSATVVVTKEKFNNVIEITLHARGDRFLHAVGKATDWEPAMTDVVAKVLHQVEKLKGKWHERTRRGPAARSAKTSRPARSAQSRGARPVTGRGIRDAAPTSVQRDVPKKRRVLKSPRYSVKPMTIDEAAWELEDRQASLIVFRNARTDAVNVLHRREDGQIALIEPEA